MSRPSQSPVRPAHTRPSPSLMCLIFFSPGPAICRPGPAAKLCGGAGRAWPKARPMQGTRRYTWSWVGDCGRCLGLCQLLSSFSDSICMFTCVLFFRSFVVALSFNVSSTFGLHLLQNQLTSYCLSICTCMLYIGCYLFTLTTY